MLRCFPVSSLINWLETRTDDVKVITVQLAQILAYQQPGYGKLRLPNMEVNGKGLFSREIYDRLKIICLSSCVDLKVNFLNSLTINGGAKGYGMLLMEFLGNKRHILVRSHRRAEVAVFDRQSARNLRIAELSTSRPPDN